MGYSREKALKKLEEMKQRREKMKKDFFNLKPGPNNVRILPNWNGETDGDFFRETSYHKNLGPDRDKNAVCLVREGGDYCPVCDFQKKLYATKNKEDAELAKSIRAQRRVLFNVVDLDAFNEAKDFKGVQVWMTGTDILEQILGYDANPKYEDVTDPDSGRNLVVIYTEGAKTKSHYNEYQVQPDPERSQIANPEWLLQMIDLDAHVKLTSVEDMIELIGAEAEESAPPGARALRPIEQQPAAAQETKTSSKKACFGKHEPSDVECQTCKQDVACQEEKNALKAKATTVKEPQEVQKDISPSAASKSTEIQSLMARLKAERGAKK